MEKDNDIQVRSANDWEDADLGDDARKQKFLKLMGAGKKEHHGKIVIGDNSSSVQHSRSQDQTKKIESDLMEQYQTSLKNKLTGSSRHHVGLGFGQSAEPTDKDTIPKDGETASIDEKNVDDNEGKKRKQDEVEGLSNAEEEPCKRSKDEPEAVAQEATSTDSAESERSAANTSCNEAEGTECSATAATKTDCDN